MTAPAISNGCVNGDLRSVGALVATPTTTSTLLARLLAILLGKMPVETTTGWSNMTAWATSNGCASGGQTKMTQGRAAGVAVDGSGNVLVAGETYGAVGGPNIGESDSWLVKYDNTGVQQWLRQWGSPQRDSISGLVADVSDNVYVTGATYGDLGGHNAGGSDAWLAMYHSAGSQQWLRQWGAATGDNGVALLKIRLRTSI